MPIYKCTNCGPTEPCIIETGVKPIWCVTSKATRTNWGMVNDHDIIIDVNGQVMPEDTYEILPFLAGGIKIKITYHNQEGYFKEEECQKN